MSREEVTVQYSCLLVCVSLGNSMWLTAYNYLNTCPNIGVLNRNHEKNELYQKASVYPLITTPVLSSAEAFLSHKLTYLLEVIAPMSLSTASRKKL